MGCMIGVIVVLVVTNAATVWRWKREFVRANGLWQSLLFSEENYQRADAEIRRLHVIERDYIDLRAWSGESEPDYFDHLDALVAEQEAGRRGCCTCNEAYEAMHDLENTCELHN